MSKQSPFLKLARQIATDERGSLEHRYELGATLLAARAGRQRLPKGYLADRAAEIERSGLPKISEGELHRYMRLAEVYPTKAHRRHAMTLMGSWFEIVRLNFPVVTVDESDEQPDESDLQPPDAWEQLSLIPGLGETLKFNGRRVPLDDATISDVKAYRDMYAQLHDVYAKKLAQIEQALQIMRDGSGGDDTANAVDAYKRGIST